MQLLFILFLLLATSVNCIESHPSFTAAANCSDRHDQVDVLFSEILGFGSVEQRFPENRTQLKSFCSNQQRLIAALNDYKEDCLAGFTSGSERHRRKQIFSLAIHSLRHWNGRICGHSSKLGRQLLASASCANAAANGYRRCLNSFTSLVASSRSAGQRSESRQATLCCAYHRTLECMREVGLRVSESCSETSIELHQQYVQLLFGGSVEVVCSTFDEVTDRCERLVWSRSAFSKKEASRRKKKLWRKKSAVWSEKPYFADISTSFKPSSSCDEIVQLKPFFNLMLDTLSSKT